MKVVVDEESGFNARDHKEWVLETDSMNLKKVMSKQGVNFKRTYSNSCMEVFKILGIEAT
jgi:DNA-directed RNA polymerase II subunit RPB1